MRARMSDVAKAAGVSVMTVSRAFRRDGRVSAETRARVLEAARRLDYLPDALAAGLSSKRSGFVAALVPSLNNPHFADTVRGLSEAIEDSGLQVLVGQTNYGTAREERLLAALLRRRPEAIVLTVDGHSEETRASLRRAGVPVIEVWDWPDEPIDHVVGFSNRAAAQSMVEHLADRGYRRIAFVGESHDEGTRGARRREGYLVGLAARGLGPPRVAAHGPPPITMMQGRAALRTVLERWPDTDAVMCVSDPCAFGALVEAQSLGRDVPTLGIAGFGDFEVSRCCVPSLTTVSINAEGLGREVGGLVLARLAGRPCASIEIATKIEPRESTC